MLRVAVLGDVHGNAFALEAVLADMRSCAPDLLINLGDQVTGRADPLRAYELQRGLEAVEVLGSAEPRLLDDDPFHEWLRMQLPAEAIAHLMSLPLTARVAEGAIFACHGAPDDPEGHLFWSWQRGPYLASAAEDLRRAVEPLEARVVLCGHTHREALTVLDDTLIVNVGAVGAQVGGDPRARWALLQERDGRWLVDFRRVSYDWDQAAGWVRANAPDPETEAPYLVSG